MLLVQNFVTINDLELRDTHLALMIPYWGSAFGVLLLRQTFREVPFELEEAARVSGSTEFGALMRITIPLMLPMLVYTWLLVFILAIPELSASIILRGFGTQTVATSLLSVWNGNGGLAVACAYGVCIFAVVSALFLLAALVGRRSPAPPAV